MLSVHSGASGKLELNGKRFTVESLEPFGKELIPESSAGVNVQDLILTDVENMVAAAKEEKVLVISHATTSPEQEWCHIKPRAHDVSQIPHLDYNGLFPLLFWTIDGEEREPTAFAKIDDFTQAMKKNAQFLSTPSLPEESKNHTWVQTIKYIRSNLEGLSPVDFRAPEELNRRMLLDIQYDRLLGAFPDPSMTSRLLAAITKKDPNAERRKLNKVRDICLQTMQVFAKAVTTDLEPKSLVHKWKDKPKSAAIAYNLAASEGEEAEPVVHFGLHDTTISKPCMLRRAEINAGKQFHVWKGT